MKEDIQKKYKLISQINWDYNYSEEEILKIIEDTNNDTRTRNVFYVKSLETLTWQDLLFLWGFEEVNRLYTEKTRKMIFSKYLREEYDIVFKLLREHKLTYIKRTKKEYEEFKATLLYNRKNLCKNREFSSFYLKESMFTN